jgi:uncharacterized protein YjeT (DUF2065 family)
MILRKLNNSPEKLIPVAMMFITVGMMLIVVATAWHKPLIPVTSGTDWNDFLRGFALGLAIVMEIAGLVIALAAARAKKAIETAPAPRP